MMKIFLASVFVVLLVIVCYGQLYEPEHLWHRSGYQPEDWFGRYIAGIEDVNDDGFDDFLASNKFEGTALEGHVFLFYGGNPPDTIPDVVFNNPYPYGYFGGNIENVGDVNGDQRDDFAVLGGYSQDNRHIVFIYFGGILLDTIPDVMMSEVVYSDIFGSNIEGVGDVNGDGYDDIAVHASNYSGVRGKVWVYFGGNPMDTIADWEQQGNCQNASFGQSIAGKGDLNGDGYDDFAVYEWTGYPNHAETTYYIYYGSDELDTIPDVIVDGQEYYPDVDISNSSALTKNLNGDSFSDLVIVGERSTNAVIFHGGDPMDTEIDLVLEGFDPNPPGSWNMNVSVVGDVNSDNFDDVIVAQLAAYGGGGLVLVYLGGLWMDGQPDMRWEGIQTPWDGCGKSLDNVGDISGDGVDDIIFGSYHYQFNTQGSIDIWKGDTTFVVAVPVEPQNQLPQKFRLLPPYPNPFNSNLIIPFEINPGLVGDINLRIYNILGQEVIDLTVEALNNHSAGKSGYYEVTWDGKDPSGIEVGSGVYIVVLHISIHRQLQKVTLLR